MTVTIKNLSGIPFDVATLNGPAILPANGEIEADLSAFELEVMRQSPTVQVIEGKAEKKPDPLDHDGDGGKGGSKPAEERGLDKLREDAEGLGIKVDQRWGEKRLQAEIDKKLAE